MKTKEQIHEILTREFNPSSISFRLAETGKTQRGIWAKLLVYINARDVQNRLDEAFGISGWSTSFRVINDINVECTITAEIEGRVIKRSDVGSANDGGIADKMKSAYSDSLKRAAVSYGIGRHLYDDKYKNLFAEVTTNRPDYTWNYGKTKQGEVFFWKPPKLN